MQEDVYSDEGSSEEVVEDGDVPFRPASRSNYSTTVTKILRKWFEKHIDNPYPSEEERVKICEQTGLTRKQLRVWFINSRKRKLAKVVTKKHKVSKPTGEAKARKQLKLECDVLSEASSSQIYNIDYASTLDAPQLNQKIPVMNLMLKYHIYLNKESTTKMNNFVNQIQKYCFCDVIEFGVVKNQHQLNFKYM